MATPFDLRSAMTRNRISTSGALSAEVGSSMMRMRALRATALAISTSCCWPIIRSSTVARGSTPVCRRSIRASVWRSCSAWSMRPRRMISRLAKIFSATERLPNRFSSWNTMPMPCAIASRGVGECDRLCRRAECARRSVARRRRSSSPASTCRRRSRRPAR